MIRLSLDQRAVAAFDILQARFTQVDLGKPVVIFDVTPRPMAVLAIPAFPVDEEQLGLMGASGFLDGVDGPLHGVDG